MKVQLATNLLLMAGSESQDHVVEDPETPWIVLKPAHHYWDQESEEVSADCMPSPPAKCPSPPPPVRVKHTHHCPPPPSPKCSPPPSPKCSPPPPKCSPPPPECTPPPVVESQPSPECDTPVEMSSCPPAGCPNIMADDFIDLGDEQPDDRLRNMHMGVEVYTSAPQPYVADDSHCLDPWTIINSNPHTAVFAALARIAGLREYLAGVDKATLLLPSNMGVADALGALNIDQPTLVANPSVTKALVQYHVIPGLHVWTTDILAHPTQLYTVLTGRTVRFRSVMNGSFMTVEGDRSVGKILEGDLYGCKVVIHIIDYVLLPDVAIINQVIAESQSAKSFPLGR